MFRHVEFALVSTLFATQFAAAADLPKEGDFKLTFHVVTKSRRSIPMPEGQFANLNLETLVTTNEQVMDFSIVPRADVWGCQAATLKVAMPPASAPIPMPTVI